jgi:paraquat-inducible protein B
MSKPSNPTLIGSFVLGAVVLLVAATLLFGGAELFASKRVLVSYFEDSVKGLREGSNVMLNGVRIGYVKTIQLQGEVGTDNSMHMLAEVTMQVFPESYELFADGTTMATDARSRLTTDQYVKAGIRAKLGTDSFVTGQLLVEFVFDPGEPAVFRKRRPGGPEEIPTIPSDVQQVIDRVQDFFSKISKDVDLGQVAKNLQGIVSGLNEIANSPDLRKTLAGASKLTNEDLPHLASALERSLAELQGAAKDARSLVTHVDKQVDPLMTDLLPAVQRLDTTLEAAEQVLRDASGHLRDDSELSLEVRHTLQDLQSASDAATVLLDYLGNHPEALLRGKRK